MHLDSEKIGSAPLYILLDDSHSSLLTNMSLRLHFNNFAITFQQLLPLLQRSLTVQILFQSLNRRNDDINVKKVNQDQSKHNKKSNNHENHERYDYYDNRKKNNRHSYHEAFDRRDNRDSFKSRYNNEDYQGSFKGGNRDFRRGQRQGYEEVPRYNLLRDNDSLQIPFPH